METKTINVYKFSELSDKAKQRAIYDDQSNGDWPREGEYMDSLKKLAEHFGGKLVDWSIDYSNSTSPSSADFEMGAQEDSGLSKTAWEKYLREKLNALGSYNKKTLRGDGDCKLTGTCYDENAIDGFRTAFIREGERDLNALMQAAFQTWIKALWADYAYDYDGGPEGGYAETADANDWRYTEDGRFWRGR